MAEQLEIGAHGITAILATWLGLIVLTRAGRQSGAKAFAFVTGMLVVWSVAIIIERLSTDAGVDVAFNAVEDVAAFLLPAATLHVALALTAEGPMSPNQRRALVAAYVLCGAVALEAVFFPDQQLAVTPPHLEPFGIPGEIMGWAWILARLVILGAALYWIVAALRVAGDDVARQRQLQAALATVGVGALGGVVRILPGVSESDPWIGVSLVTASMVLAAYAVFVQGLFMSTDAAGRAFSYTMVVGIGVTLFVALLVALERVTQEVLHVQLPIVTGLALVVTIALLGPLTDLVRARAARPLAARSRLLPVAAGTGRGGAHRAAAGHRGAAGPRPPDAHLPPEGAAVLSPTGELLAEHGGSGRTTRWRCAAAGLPRPDRGHRHLRREADRPAVHRARGRPADVGRGLPRRVAEPGGAAATSRLPRWRRCPRSARRC